jgi:hypothetical protein
MASTRSYRGLRANPVRARRTTPQLEPLEARRLLAFDQGSILLESFDDLSLTHDQFYSPGGWDDNKTIPAPTGSNQPPQPTNIPLFHHVMTATAPDSTAFLIAGGTTLFNGLSPQLLDLSGVRDVVTFPSVDPAHESLALVSIDIAQFNPRNAPTVTVTGAGGSETLTAANIIGGTQTRGWDTYSATANDLLPGGAKLGPISQVVLTGPDYALGDFDNLRVLIASTGGGSPGPVAANDLYVLPEGAMAGQDFHNGSVLANDSGSSGATLHARLIQAPAHDPAFQLNDDGTFTYHPDATFQGTDTFTYVASDGTAESNAATVTIVTTGSPLDTDGDGVPDVVEARAPNGGDGNGDGAPDYLESKVASLNGADGQYWTLVTSDGNFAGVSDAAVSTSMPAPPQDVALHAGLFSFQVRGIAPGAAVVVQLTPASNSFASGFYEFDSISQNWDAMPADVAPGGVVTLHLVDGGQGDLDGEADGVLTVEGGPADLTGTPFARDIHVPVAHATRGSISIPSGAAQLNSGPVQLDLVHGGGNDPFFGIVSVDQNSATFTYTSYYKPKDSFGNALAGWSQLVVGDSFAYQVEINGHASAVARAYIEPVNQAPTAEDVNRSFISSSRPEPVPRFEGDLPASDADGDPLVFSIIPGSEQNARVTLDGDRGHYVYDPMRPPRGSFRYEVRDVYGATTSATVTYNIEAPDAPPAAINDVVWLPHYPPLANEVIQVPGTMTYFGAGSDQLTYPIFVDGSWQGTILANDIGTGPLTAHLVTGPRHALAVLPTGDGTSPGFQLFSDGSFVYAPGPDFQGTDFFTYVANDGITDGNVAWVTIVSFFSSLDSNGVGTPDWAQALGPNNGDANHDGIPDVLQPNVATIAQPSFSAPADPGEQVETLVAPDGTAFHNVAKFIDASPPPGVILPYGLVDFALTSNPAGGALPSSPLPIHLIPSQPFNPAPDVYLKVLSAIGGYEFDPFPYDPATGTGALLSPTEITLFIRDNGRGDEDPDPGSITDPGGPAYFVPVPTVEGPPVGVREQPLSFTLAASDRSAAKLAAGFTYTIDWGDGSPSRTIARTPSNGAGVPLEHVYERAGTYQVTVTATDELGMGDRNRALKVPVTIRAVALEADPLYPGQIMLAVGGTEAADKIRVRRVRHSGLRVMIDGIDQGIFHPTGRIAVFDGDGNDDIRIGPRVHRAAWLMAGNGNDLLIGGAGNDVLVAGNGHDRLFARGGHDMLVVRPRRDHAHFRRGRDLVIRDTGAIPSAGALATLVATWIRKHTPAPSGRGSE